jgi:hypothetical protein
LTASVDQAWLSLRDLRFRQSCNRPDQRADARGPLLVDLVSGRASGLPERLLVEAARYCRLTASMRPAEGAAVPEMRGVPVLVRGQRRDGVPFILRSRRIELLNLQARDREGFAVGKGTSRIFVAADVARWMSGIDLASAEVTRDWRGPLVTINERTNSQLLEVFERHFARGLLLFRDRDGNGVLSAEERSETECLASGVP